MTKFQLVPYDPDLKQLDSVYVECRDASGAKSRAATLCRRHGGPVDVALDNEEPWELRYLTTAHPSEFHSNKVRFERLS